MESVRRSDLQEKLAIIGTGIAGMSAAYFLYKNYDITLFEKNSYVGGHSNTVEVKEGNSTIAIDTGFIVYNEVTYPLLTRLFKELKVPTKNSNMSFSVQHKPSGLEFCGSGIDGLFAQRRNIFNWRFYRLLYNINRFNHEAPKILDNPNFQSLTLSEYLNEFHYHPDLAEYYLIPMSSAVWSTPIKKMLDFPATTLIRFFFNHGFLGLNTQHQWKTVEGGSRNYVMRLIEPFKDKIHLNSAVQRVQREGSQVYVKVNEKDYQFDKVIFACHADQVLKIFENPSLEEKELLGCFKYENNLAVLHTDSSVMPNIRKAWSSWNYIVKQKTQGNWKDSTLAYWMNSLQGVSKNQNYFVSINDMNTISQEKILYKVLYEHPLFNVETASAQHKLSSLNGKSNVYYCGSYFRYGFHEDALLSSYNLAKVLLGKEPW